VWLITVQGIIEEKSKVKSQKSKNGDRDERTVKKLLTKMNEDKVFAEKLLTQTEKEKVIIRCINEYF
jgi:hypothetical protein